MSPHPRALRLFALALLALGSLGLAGLRALAAPAEPARGGVEAGAAGPPGAGDFRDSSAAWEPGDPGGPAAARPAGGGLGLWRGFIPNGGQFVAGVDFAWAGGERALWLEGGRLRWVGAGGRDLGRLDLGPLTWEGRAPLPGRLHVYLGADRAHWAVGLPRYSRLEARGAGGARWSLAAEDGAAGLLALRCEGAAACRTVALRRAVQGLARAGLLGRWAAAPGAASAPPPLGLPGLVRPWGPAQAADAAALVYATHLGGGQDDQVRGLAVDAEGRALVAGATSSADLPLAGRPFQGAMGSSGQIQDAFVARLAADGRSLDWAGFLGGSRQDEALDLAVDALGRPSLVGYTLSGDWPMARPVQDRVNLADGVFSGDAVVARLSADGASLEFSSPLGGTARDIAKAVAVDPAGNTVVGGLSASNFPTLAPIQRLNRGAFDVFVFKLRATDDRLAFSTLLGGTADDALRDLVLDAAGDIHAVGETRSLNFRFKSPAYQVGNAGGLDAFYLKLKADGSEVLASSNYGGKADDLATGLAVGADGSATLVGWTRSADLPRERPLQRGRSGDSDLFLARFSPDGLRLTFGSYWGGSRDEGGCSPPEALRSVFTPTPDPRGGERLPGGSRFSDAPPADLALDSAGRIALASCSDSPNYPRVAALPLGAGGGQDLVLSILDPQTGSLPFSQVLGGSGTDMARRLEWSAAGELYLAGQTDSPDFPTWPAPPLQERRRGQSDGFVLKLGLPAGLRPPASPTPSPSPSPSPLASATVEATPTRPQPSATASEAPPTALPPTATPSPQPPASPRPPPLFLPWLAR